MSTAGADPDLQYLFRHQIAEADLLCLTKWDLYPKPPVLSVPVEFTVSAKTGDGIDEWLNEILSGKRIPGAKLLEVEYQRYASAEAALGWLNLHAEVSLQKPLSPAAFAGPLLDEIDTSLSSVGIAIAHLKIFDETSSGYIKASICTNGGTPAPEGDLLAEPASRHEFVINLRTLGDPDHLRAIVNRALSAVPGSINIRHAGAFRPMPPKPEYRFSEIASD